MRVFRHRAVKTLLPLTLISGGLCAAAGAVSWNGFTFIEWWRETRSGVVRWHGNTREKLIALTFDDGPDPRYTPRILAILRAYHAPATFFEEGRYVRKYPELAQRVLAEGHVIGNHTQTHPYLNRENAAQVRMEVMTCERNLESALHRRVYLFRPPRGLWNPTIYREVRRNGDHIVLWNLALEHHDAPTPRLMAARVLRLVKPGSIVLMHDGGSEPRDRTVQALPLVLEGLRKRGYHLVTVPQLLHIRGNEAINPPL